MTGPLGNRGELDRLLGLRREASTAGEPRSDVRRLVRADWHLFATPRPTPPGEPVGEAFALEDGEHLAVVRTGDGRLHVPFDLDEAYLNYLSEAWVGTSSNRRLSPRTLAFYYGVKRVVPRTVQLRARRALIQRQQGVTFPGWPLDRGVEHLAALYLLTILNEGDTSEVSIPWFWPDASRAALILTHDVETTEGQRLALELADLEEEHGFRSAFNFGGWYDADPGVLRELDQRGFEIGMHGLIHDRTLFSSRAAFEGQLPGLRSLADRLGAVGFRSPATHRVWDWLGELPVEYDGTIPHSDPYEPQPGGCCSLWPFFVGDVVELPYTLPQDHTLLTLLGHRTATLWLETARSIEERFGLIHCITHPDRGYLAEPDRRAVYREFLVGMSEREAVWHALPRVVARWWRDRDAGETEGQRMGCARRSDVGHEAELHPPEFLPPLDRSGAGNGARVTRAATGSPANSLQAS